jgi:cytochrome c oxidase cbb3-type subunit 3
MADFTSGFWSLYIAALTVLGIAFCFWIVWWMSTGKVNKPGETETTGHSWDGDLQEMNNPLPGWWKNMFYITLVFGIGYLVLYPGLGAFAGVLGWTQQGMHAEEVKEAAQLYDPLYKQYAGQSVVALGTDPKALRIGERLYLTYCTACHGADAKGVPGYPNLSDSDWLWGGEPDQIKASILNGRTGVMPAWEAPLGGAAGVEDMTQHVLSLGQRPHDEGKAARGKEKYTALCAGCHGSEGKGNAALGAPNLTDGIWVYGGSPRAIAESIAKGRNGRMPAHKDFLGDDKAHLLTAYIYSLSR